MSSFGRLLNWLIPSLGVQDDQLRPDASYVNRVLSAANDIRLCEEIFNGWATHLDKVRGERPDERERQVRHYIDWLTQDARQCSETTDKILWCHAQFARLMAREIDGATESEPKALDCGMDTKGLANYISTASRSLSQNVVKMNSDLESFVSYLEKMQVKEEKSMACRILGWLKLFFEALAGIFALGSFIAPFLKTAAPGVDLVAPAASALSIAAAELCKMAAESLEAREPQSIESVLLFFKKTVPKEAREAQQTLGQFNAALVFMGIEKHMMTGRLLAFSRPDSAAIAQEWRDVANRYQSVLPDDGYQV